MRRILRSELQQIQAVSTQPTQTEALLATFGTWEDKRPVETIIEEIYSSRTISPLEA